MKPRVLVVDDDPTVCALLLKTLSRGGFVVEVAHRGDEALQRLTSPDAPRLLLLDWLMPGKSGIEVCRELRAMPSGAGVHVTMISSRQRQEDVLEAFDAGVDDFLPKPFEPGVLLARLRAASRRLLAENARGPQGLRFLLDKMARSMATGEVIVRSQRRVGRVVLHQGKVAWVHTSGDGSLLQVLREGGLPEHDVRSVFEECRVRRLPFLDTLVEWGLVERGALETHLHQVFSGRLEGLLAMPDSASFFVPGESRLESGFHFELSEIMPPPSGLLEAPALDPSLESGAMPPERCARITRGFCGLQGVECAALFETPSGLLLSEQRGPFDASLAQAMLQLLLASSGEDEPQIWVVNRAHYNVLRRLSAHHAIYLRVNREECPNIGLLRHALRTTTESLIDAAP